MYMVVCMSHILEGLQVMCVYEPSEYLYICVPGFSERSRGPILHVSYVADTELCYVMDLNNSRYDYTEFQLLWTASYQLTLYTVNVVILLW